MVNDRIAAILVACLVISSCQSSNDSARGDLPPQPVPTDSAERARYFNNCGIVIRPAVQYEISYLVSDEAITGRDYVEELTLFISVPKGRAGKLMLHGEKPNKAEPLPTPEFAALPAGLHTVDFQLLNDKTSVVWRLNGQGPWKPVNGTVGVYDKNAAFKEPQPLDSVSDPTMAINRLRPFKPISIDIYGVTRTVYLRDAK